MASKGRYLPKQAPSSTCYLPPRNAKTQRKLRFEAQNVASKVFLRVFALLAYWLWQVGLASKGRYLPEQAPSSTCYLPPRNAKTRRKFSFEAQNVASSVFLRVFSLLAPRSPLWQVRVASKGFYLPKQAPSSTCYLPLFGP